jgi:hypothetical protein
MFFKNGKITILVGFLQKKNRCCTNEATSHVYISFVSHSRTVFLFLLTYFEYFYHENIVNTLFTYSFDTKLKMWVRPLYKSINSRDYLHPRPVSVTIQ